MDFEYQLNVSWIWLIRDTNVKQTTTKIDKKITITIDLKHFSSFPVWAKLNVVEHWKRHKKSAINISKIMDH